MKTSIVAISCALCAAACGGSNYAPAQSATYTATTPNPGGVTEMMATTGATPSYASDCSSWSIPARQGTSQAETDITHAIKQSIAADRALSGRASQVKVCTAGTIVTLHGTVDTETDRAAVDDLAWGTADVREVDDRIVVKR